MNHYGRLRCLFRLSVLHCFHVAAISLFKGLKTESRTYAATRTTYYALDAVSSSRWVAGVTAECLAHG